MNDIQRPISILWVINTVFLFRLSVCFLLSILGQFDYLWLLDTLIVITLLFSFGWYFVVRVKSESIRAMLVRAVTKVASSEHALVMLFLSLVVIGSGYFYHQTLGADRDYGGYVVDAIAIVKDSSIYHNSELILPGSGYTLDESAITTGKLPLYSVYLASFYHYFGLWGLFYANTFLILITVWNMYFIIRNLGVINIAYLYPTFFLLNYTTLYFSRRTLSENLFLYLVWVAVYGLTELFKNKRHGIFWLLFSFTAVVLCLPTRTDSVMYLASFTMISLGYGIRWFIKDRTVDLRLVAKMTFFTKIMAAVFIIAIVSVLAYCYSGVADDYIDIARNITKIGGGILNSMNGSTSAATGVKYFPSPNFIYVLKTLWGYFLVPFILLGAIGLVCLGKSWSYKLVAVLVFLTPAFVFILDPRIAMDHPWMLRRLWPTFIPLIFLLSVLAIDRITNKFLLSNKLIGLFLVGILLTGNLITAKSVIGYTEYRDNEHEAFVNLFDSSSLVIFPTDYYDAFGRWASYFYYHEGIDVLWPADKQGFNTGDKTENFVRRAQLNKRDIFLVSSYKPEEDKIDRLGFVDQNDLKLASEYNLKMYRMRETAPGYPPGESSTFEKTYYIYKLEN